MSVAVSVMRWRSVVFGPPNVMPFSVTHRRRRHNIWFWGLARNQRVRARHQKKHNQLPLKSNNHLKVLRRLGISRLGCRVIVRPSNISHGSNALRRVFFGTNSNSCAWWQGLSPKRPRFSCWAHNVRPSPLSTREFPRQILGVELRGRSSKSAGRRNNSVKNYGKTPSISHSTS